MLVVAIPIFLMRSLRSSHARFSVVSFSDEICSDSTVGTVWSGLIREGVKNIPWDGGGAESHGLGPQVPQHHLLNQRTLNKKVWTL